MTEQKDIKKLRVELSLAKRRAMKELDDALKELDLYEDKADWSFLERVAHDIEASYTVQQKKISTKELVRQMESHSKDKYQEYPELVEKIIAALPSHQRVLKWRKKKNWQSAIWNKCKDTGLFTNDNRSIVIDKLFQKIVDKQDVAAAKIWLTLSGDYVEKSEQKIDKVQDIFREINEKLHKKS